MVPEIVAFLHSRVESQFGEVISDPESEFQVSRSSLSYRPRGSSPSRSSARQAASRSEHAHKKDTRYFEGIAILPGSDQFLCTASRSGKITHAPHSTRACIPLGSLPDLPRSGSDWVMVSYRVDTSVSTSVKFASGYLPVHGQFAGGVGGCPSVGETSKTFGEDLTDPSTSIT